MDESMNQEGIFDASARRRCQGIDECGTCHAKLDNGKHLCMVDFVSPERVLMSVFRESTLVWKIELREGDVVEYESFDNEDEVIK